MLMPALSDMINLASAAEIYRWRDAQGKLHYGELVPQDADYEQLDQSTLPPVHTLPVAEKSPQVETTSNRAQQKKSRPKSRRGVQENSRIKRCRRYQEQLETIQSKLRAGYREPQGNRLRAKRRQLEQHQREEC
jgi:hypothetical protein